MQSVAQVIVMKVMVLLWQTVILQFLFFCRCSEWKIWPIVAL